MAVGRWAALAAGSRHVYREALTTGPPILQEGGRMALLARQSQARGGVPAATGERRRRIGTRIWSVMVTTDHKVIGRLYFVTSMGFFLLGGALALVVRAELFSPGMQFVSHEVYNEYF